jgi:hypothetical protein
VQHALDNARAQPRAATVRGGTRPWGDSRLWEDMEV